MRLIPVLAAIGIAAGFTVRPSILELSVPLDGLREIDLRDMFHEGRSGHEHEAIDLLAPRGTPVRAVVPGIIKKLFLSKAGGKTVYQFDEAGNYCYYYAHLDEYAAGVTEDMRVERGDVIGFVGSTGNADPRTPHLHFAIFEVGPEKQWWKGTAIDPYPYLLAAVRRADRPGRKIACEPWGDSDENIFNFGDSRGGNGLRTCGAGG